MTNTELSRYYSLRKEIAGDEERLAELRLRASSVSSPMLTGMPRAKGGPASNKIERIVAEIVDLEATIRNKTQRCIRERIRLEKYIAGLDDSLTRILFTARFVEGLTWEGVAEYAGGDCTSESVKKHIVRYLSK